ncbi:hypothetical protein C5167_050568 [Papaver somniferum]|uniref:Uncharacterized protein n=1 Tax=Papaver somniferum TaxID=3469 RepID=A0A4Y7KSF3_PAPSO|nr:hypothetical protein C5167_050568 [Papaver somniferum]
MVNVPTIIVKVKHSTIGEKVVAAALIPTHGMAAPNSNNASADGNIMEEAEENNYLFLSNVQKLITYRKGIIEHGRKNEKYESRQSGLQKPHKGLSLRLTFLDETSIRAYNTSSSDAIHSQLFTANITGLGFSFVGVSLTVHE